jgi:hypothetical protein
MQVCWCIYVFEKKSFKGDENLIPMNGSTKRKSKSTSKIQSLDAEDADDEGFIEGDINTGNVLRAFSFGMSTALEKKKPEMPSTQNQPLASAPRGLTPPVKGEQYTVKRSYTMRPSTVKKLNALKTEHPDVNVLFNTMVDMAISHYYNYIFNEHGSFSSLE